MKSLAIIEMIDPATSADSKRHHRSDCNNYPADTVTTVEPEKEQCRLHFFHMYFISAYYFCIAPFRPVFNRNIGHWDLQGNVFQKIICYMVWTMAMLNRITDARSAWQADRKHGKYGTISYFKLAHAHTHVLLNFLFYLTLISKLDKIKGMIEVIGHSKLLHPTPKYRWILVFVCHTIWMVFGFLAPVVGFEVTECVEWGSSHLFRVYVAQAKYTFFLDNNSTLAKHPVDSEEVFGLVSFLGMLQILITLAHNLQLFFTLCLLATCSLTVWSASTQFIKQVVENHYKSKKEFLEGFQELRNISQSVNDVWSLFCFWYLMDLLAWLSTELDTGLMIKKWYVKLHIFYYLICLGAALIFSAESYRKIQRLRVRMLHQHIKDAERLDFQHVRAEEIGAFDMVWNSICVGSSGFYKINYRFIGKITATIITFFIISVEYKEEDLDLVKACG